MRIAVVCCLLVAASVGEGRASGSKLGFTAEDMKEVVGFTAYFVNRLGHKKSAKASKQAAQDAMESSYVNNICSTLERGWELPDIHLFRDSAGDICYYSARYIFGKSEEIAADVREECRSSKYVEYIHTAIKRKVFKPESSLISEAFGDACYWSCTRSRSKCLARERRCEKTQYVDLVYNLFQGKNRFTDAVVNEMIEDGCFLGHYLTQGKNYARARDFGAKCRHHEVTKLLVALFQIAMKHSGWPLDVRSPRYYEDDMDF